MGKSRALTWHQRVPDLANMRSIFVSYSARVLSTLEDVVGCPVVTTAGRLAATVGDLGAGAVLFCTPFDEAYAEAIEVGTIVRYTNGHGFPRAAIVTGTVASLEGEKHCPPLSGPTHVHLQVFSPLPRSYAELDVPFDADNTTPRPGMWRFQP